MYFFVKFNVVEKPNGTFLAREFQENSSDLQTELVEKIWYDQSLFLLVIIIFISSHKILSLDYIYGYC